MDSTGGAGGVRDEARLGLSRVSNAQLPRPNDSGGRSPRELFPNKNLNRPREVYPGKTSSPRDLFPSKLESGPKELFPAKASGLSEGRAQMDQVTSTTVMASGTFMLFGAGFRTTL